ncbi:MAG: MBL fold metallo-hydrolase [Bacteroidales bacterium]|nr:MBL fold metallo-hydrolase [Bacteroidales bacterium]
MISFLSLSSGSSGNCYYFSDGKVSFLVDAGVGPRTCSKKLSEKGIRLQDIDFILVTHDHSDHIKALWLISSKYHKPVFATDAVAGALHHSMYTKGKLGGSLHTINIGEEEDICSVKVTAFEVSHDATQTVGYFIEMDGRRITLVTDCGRMTSQIAEYAKKADVLILESNYDEKMLEEGDYTYVLKERIRSGSGHLSNSEAAQALKDIWKNRQASLSRIFLCHLSDNNNTPELALGCSGEALRQIGAESCVLEALPRGKASELYFI